MAFDFPNSPTNGQQVTASNGVKRERLPYPCPFKRAYAVHKGVAKYRGIPFLLSREQWKRIWIESGKWEQRGNRRGQYVMARYGDKGGYEIGNVRICLSEENRAERNQVYRVTGERNHNHGKNINLFLNKAAKRKHRQASIRTASRRARDERGCFLPGRVG